MYVLHVPIDNGALAQNMNINEARYCVYYEADNAIFRIIYLRCA